MTTLHSPLCMCMAATTAASAATASSVLQEARLVFPDNTPRSYEALMRACTNRDPDQRSPFTDIVKMLEDMSNTVKIQGWLD